MQTAGIRSQLEPEYEFEFVEGRWPHLEGNWSLHTVDFSKSNVSIGWRQLIVSAIGSPGHLSTCKPLSQSFYLLKCLPWGLVKRKGSKQFMC
jgi:hypothetical protein